MRNIMIVGLALLAGACAEIKVTLPPYQPVTSSELKGAIAVNNFAYTPKAGVKPDEIRTTTLSTLAITEGVSTYFANAVRREFRQAGLSLVTDKCAITGTVYDFAIDDLGFSATYITDVEYQLKGSTGAVLHSGRYQVSFSTTKRVAASIVLANIQKAVSDNIGQLLTDDGFRSAIPRCR